MDLYARKIIAWTLSDSMEVSCVTDTINKSKERRCTDLPLIIHSDRGSQYVSQAYCNATSGMQRSYSHTGYPYDNACIEAFRSLIKREWLNRFQIQNYDHAYRLVFEYIETFTIQSVFTAIVTICLQMTLRNCMKRLPANLQNYSF